MLVHHGTQEYNVAASAAADAARAKFESQIERGKERATAVLNQINEQQPVDRIVKGSALNFIASAEDGVLIRYPGDAHGTERIHRHALGQAAARVEIPLGYIDKLADRKAAWANELIAHNLNHLFHNTNGSKYLTRSVKGEVRGFLSDSYRRLDSRPIVEAFIQAVQSLGAIPLEGYALETKIALKAALPLVFEPVPNEVMIYGVALENSDFGNGALSLRSWIERLWCTNFAIASEDLRKIHLGARMTEDLKLSQRTYDLDTQTMASAINDLVNRTLSGDAVNQYMGLISKANEEKLEWGKAREFLKKNLLKGEVDAVTEAFNGADIEMLPPGNSNWRFSNAISWVAGNKIENEERKLELMKVAGKVLEWNPAKAVEGEYIAA